MNKYSAQQKYQKNNMLSISVKYKKDFVLEFRKALEKLDLKQSDIFRQAMQDIIDKSKKDLDKF